MEQCSFQKPIHSCETVCYFLESDLLSKKCFMQEIFHQFAESICGISKYCIFQFNSYHDTFLSHDTIHALASELARK